MQGNRCHAIRARKGREQSKQSDQDREAYYERGGEGISEKRQAVRASESSTTEKRHEHNTARQQGAGGLELMACLFVGQSAKNIERLCSAGILPERNLRPCGVLDHCTQAASTRYLHARIEQQKMFYRLTFWQVAGTCL
jgi:hypothetical protein